LKTKSDEGRGATTRRGRGARPELQKEQGVIWIVEKAHYKKEKRVVQVWGPPSWARRKSAIFQIPEANSSRGQRQRN